MDALPQAASVILSPSILAAYGPAVPLVLFFLWMLVPYLRGREARLAAAEERRATEIERDKKDLRERESALFENQAKQLDEERVLRAALEAKVRLLDDLVLRQRRAIFDYYVIARENAHAAVNAQQIIVTAGLKPQGALPPPTFPDLPKAD